MAGSKRPSIYITDIADSAGTGKKVIVINGDESNARTTGGVAATTANTAGKEFASQGKDYLAITPRYILVQGINGAGEIVRRKLIAYDPDNTLFKTGGTVSLGVMTDGVTAESVTFSVTGVVGEKRTLVPALIDTGLTDGSAA